MFGTHFINLSSAIRWSWFLSYTKMCYNYKAFYCQSKYVICLQVCQGRAKYYLVLSSSQDILTWWQISCHHTTQLWKYSSSARPWLQSISYIQSLKLHMMEITTLSGWSFCSFPALCLLLLSTTNSHLWRFVSVLCMFDLVMGPAIMHYHNI